MAGTADRYTVAAIPMGVIAKIYAGVAVPSADSRLTLATDGTPDSVANPNAIHLGHTDAGLSLSASMSTTEFFADEIPEPIGTGIDKLDLMIEGTGLQTNDEEYLKFMGANFLTYSTAAGYKQSTIGYKTSVQYSSVAVIFPSPQDATKFAVWHLYSALNTAGIKIQVGRKQRAGSPFTIKGYGVTSRAAADQAGNIWWQI